MPRIEIDPAHERAYDLYNDILEELDGLESSRSVALARTSLQQSLLWLLSQSIADALEADGMDETPGGDPGAVSDDEGVGVHAS